MEWVCVMVVIGTATGGAAVGVGEEDGDDGERETRGDGYGGDGSGFGGSDEVAGGAGWSVDQMAGRCAMVEGEVDGGCGWMVRWICGLGRRWLVVAATDLMVATWWLWEMKSSVLMGDDGAVARGSDGRGGGGTVMVGRGDDGGRVGGA
ncbi:hypothetical protein F0562_019024 [Nyssa sinensis]|uniref:Uncharacterized protein n=1 Tax=Nyssa sinensis TaxID=561372 RepID=A0A5J4ZB73_9ASTE|nr:hypothetical protein F0562_019024 [Nyssa sinensis]